MLPVSFRRGRYVKTSKNIPLSCIINIFITWKMDVRLCLLFLRDASWQGSISPVSAPHCVYRDSESIFCITQWSWKCFCGEAWDAFAKTSSFSLHFNSKSCIKALNWIFLSGSKQRLWLNKYIYLLCVHEQPVVSHRKHAVYSQWSMLQFKISNRGSDNRLSWHI